MLNNYADSDMALTLLLISTAISFVSVVATTIPNGTASSRLIAKTTQHRDGIYILFLYNRKQKVKAEGKIAFYFDGDGLFCIATSFSL